MQQPRVMNVQIRPQALLPAFFLILLTAIPSGAQTAPSFDDAWATGAPAVVAGRITPVVADDFVRGRAEVLHFIRDDRTGQTLELHFDRPITRRIPAGLRRSLHGRVNGSRLYVRADLLDAAAPPDPATVLAASAVVSGDQPTLVVLAQFTDAAVSCSAEAIRDVMFTDPSGLSVDRQYREGSGDRVSFSGAVVGPFTIPFSSGDPCDIGAWADAADAAASAAGEPPSTYARKVYVMPSSSCAAAGYGTIGGSPSGAWIFACNLKGVFAHELGHNLGLDHASTPTAEYGDSTDPMAYGSTRLRGVNAPHRWQQGWLGTAEQQMVSQDGLYALAPLTGGSAASSPPRAIAVAKRDTGETYVFSYRVPQGFDSYIDGGYLDKVSVHRFAANGTVRTSVLLAGLAAGDHFDDAANGLTVTVVSNGPDGAVLQVAFAATACSAAGPSMTLDPVGHTVQPGSTATYTLTVGNNDPASCGSSTFTLAASAPAGWTSVVSPAMLTLAAGTTAQATLSVTPPADATDGLANVVVAASDVGTPAHEASIVATVEVKSPPACVRSAPFVSVNPQSQTARAGSTLIYTVSIGNNDSAACLPSTLSVTRGVPSGWDGSLSAATAMLAPGAVAQVTLSVTSPASAPSGSVNVMVGVADGVTPVHSVNAGATYVVEAPPVTYVDAESPSAPSSLAAVVRSRQKQVALSWTASSDNVGVAGYRVLRDGVVAATVAAVSWTDGDYVAGTTRTYAVVAFDAAGNVSTPGGAVTVTLPGGGKKR